MIKLDIFLSVIQIIAVLKQLLIGYAYHHLNNVYFHKLYNIFSPKFSSPVIITLFKGIQFSIKKFKIKIEVPIIQLENGYKKLNDYQKIILEGKHKCGTHILAKFLTKSKLIYSIEEINLPFDINFDGDLLFKLLWEYKLKNTLQTPFKLTYYDNRRTISLYWMAVYGIDLIRINPALNFKNLDLNLLRDELFYKYEMSNAINLGSSIELIKKFNDFKTEVSPLKNTNKLLYDSLYYNHYRSIILEKYYCIELIKLNEESSDHTLYVGSSQMTKDGHFIEGKTLGVDFIVLSTDEDFKLKQTEELDKKLNERGFFGIILKIKENIIEELGGEYLQFVIFPLCLHMIQKKRDKN